MSEKEKKETKEKRFDTEDIRKNITITAILLATLTTGSIFAAIVPVATGADVSTISFLYEDSFTGVDSPTGWSTGDNMVNLGTDNWSLLNGTATVTGYRNGGSGILTHRGTRGLGVSGAEDDEVDSIDKLERVEITFDTPHRLSYLEVRSLFDNEGPGGEPEEGDIDLYLGGTLVIHYNLIGVEPSGAPGAVGKVNISVPDILVDRIKYYVNDTQGYANYSEFAVARLDVEPLADYGDAPGPTYPSKFSGDGARHNPTSTECLGLNSTSGDWKDFETDARVSNLDNFDDGLLTTTITAGNSSQTVKFEVTNLLPGAENLTVNILIDLNRDGDWNDVVNGQSEHVVQNQPIPLNGTPGFTEGVFTSNPFSTVGATPGNTWLRITLTRHQIQNLPWNGTMTDTGLGWDRFEYGETEDWEIEIKPVPTPTPSPTITPTPTPTPKSVPAITPLGFLLALISLFGLAAVAMRRVHKR